MRKKLKFLYPAIIFTIFFSLPVFALPCQDVEVAYDPLTTNTHAKLVIIDGIITILGSTNWTYYSLAHNNEVSVLIKSKEVAQKLSDYFQRIWKTCQHEREG